MANVEFTRSEIVDMIPAYDQIEDCVAGANIVKRKFITYLPDPEPLADRNPSYPGMSTRYYQYVQRAVFYNVTKRTLKGLAGQIFLRDPVIEVPKLLDPVVKDANGNGVDLQQTAKQATDYTISYGRCGMLVDYPETDGRTTRADIIAGNVRPTISIYGPKDVINWRTITRKSRVILSLVVISEQWDASTDPFQLEYKKQWRVLKLVNDVYVVEIWREGEAGISITNTYTPQDANGNVLDEIPFMFIGSENNDATVDDAPLYDLSELNIAHYRNSADYEESVFVVGQPTLLIAGLTIEWKDKMGAIQLGSRTAVALPTGATGELLQMQPNAVSFEAMEHKERQMVALGAKLVEQKQVQRTAFETGVEEASETSTLATIAKNVSAAIKWGLEWCSIFVGATTINADASSNAIKFDLNTEFDLTKMEPADRAQLMKEWQGNAITFEEMRAALRRGGIATEDDETAKTKIADEQAAAMQADMDRLETETEITKPIDKPEFPAA